jgi:hypothetical protein
MIVAVVEVKREMLINILNVSPGKVVTERKVIHIFAQAINYYYIYLLKDIYNSSSRDCG